jgi:hypothetical protein
MLGVSPDGRLLVAVPDGARVGTTVYPLDGGPAVQILRGVNRLRWSSDSRFLFLSISSAAGTLFSDGRTYVIPLPPGHLLPEMPDNGFQTEEEIAKLPGVRIVEAADVAPGPSSSMYAFPHEMTQRNLYRISNPVGLLAVNVALHASQDWIRAPERSLYQFSDVNLTLGPRGVALGR